MGIKVHCYYNNCKPLILVTASLFGRNKIVNEAVNCHYELCIIHYELSSGIPVQFDRESGLIQLFQDILMQPGP